MSSDLSHGLLRATDAPVDHHTPLPREQVDYLKSAAEQDKKRGREKPSDPTCAGFLRHKTQN